MRLQSGWKLFVFSSLVGAGMSAGALLHMPVRPEQSVSGVDALGAIVGEWRSGAVNGRSIRSSCIWAPEHTAVFCENTINSTGGEHHALNLYTFDAKTGHYFYYLVQQPGDFAEVVPLTINGPLWTYSWPRAEPPGQRLRTIADFAMKGSYSWRVESSTDGEHWSTTSTGRSERVTRE